MVYANLMDFCNLPFFKMVSAPFNIFKNKNNSCSLVKKMALLVLRRVGLCVGQNQMCNLCGWLKLFLKNVRLEKIKIQKRWLLGRLSVGSFVPLLYVYFCRSFLLCRLLGLQLTSQQLGEVAVFQHKVTKNS
jgi:hypothetical protein